MSMSVTVSVMPDGSAVVSVRGEIDHGNAAALREQILGVVTQRRPSLLLVDLGLVTFLDSAAVGALVGAQRAAGTDGVRMLVQRASPFVYRQLRIMGVEGLLGPSPDTDADFLSH